MLLMNLMIIMVSSHLTTVVSDRLFTDTQKKPTRWWYLSHLLLFNFVQWLVRRILDVQIPWYIGLTFSLMSMFGGPMVFGVNIVPTSGYLGKAVMGG